MLLFLAGFPRIPLSSPTRRSSDLRVTIEGGDPEAAARRFAGEGARWLHLVDLDGAFAGAPTEQLVARVSAAADRKSTRLNSSHRCISYAVFCLKKKTLAPFNRDPN